MTPPRISPSHSTSAGQPHTFSELQSQTHKQLHLRDLLVYLLHELDYEVHKFVLQHLLGMEVRNQE